MYPSDPRSPRTSRRSSAASWRSGRRTTPSAPASSSATAATEWVFYDGPPFANGLPHYGHLLTGYAKDLFPRFQTMRGKQVRPPLRLGHPRPARRARGDAPARHHREARDRRRWASPRSTRRRASRCCTTPTSGRSTSPARRAGSTSRTTTRRSTSPSWRACSGRSSSCYDKGLAYEGFRVLPYCWRDETPLSQPRAAHGRRRLQDAPGPVGHRHLPARRREGRGARADRRRGARLDDDALDPADEPRARRRPRHRVRRSCRRPAARRVHATYLLGRPTPIGALPRKSSATQTTQDASAAAVAHRARAPSSTGVHYDRALGLLRRRETWGTQNAWRILVADYVATGEGTGIVHQAPAYGEDDQVVVRRGRHPRRSCRSTTAGGSCRACPRSPASTGSTRTSRSPQMLRDDGRLLPAEVVRAQLPALLALPQPADLQGRVELVRARAPSSATAWSSSTSRSPGCPRTSRTASSASGSRTPATGRSAATATGARRSRCGRATTPSTRASTSTARSTSSSATSAAAAQRRGESTCTARTSTS